MRAWGGRTARVLLLGKELLVRGLHHAARPHDRRGQDGLARLQVCDLAREPLVLLDNCEGGGARGERAFGGSASMGACRHELPTGVEAGPHASTRGKCTVGALHRIVQVVDQLVQTLQLALRPAPNAVPSTDLLEHRRADAKRRCGPSRGWGGPRGRRQRLQRVQVAWFSMVSSAPATSTMGLWNSGAIS